MQYRRDELGIKYYCRIMELDITTPTVKKLLYNREQMAHYKSFLCSSRLLLNKYKLPTPSRTPCSPYSPIPPWIIISHVIILDFPGNTKNENHGHIQSIFNELIENAYYDTIVIYTDGSKSSNKVTASYCIPELEIEYQIKLNETASVLTSELLAIYKALQYCYSDNKKYAIFTDSMSSLQLISNCNIKTYKSLAYDILELIQDMQNRVKLQWIPSHKGILGNERADALAKAVPDCNSETYFKVPKEDYYNLIQKNKLLKWNEDYTKEVRERQKKLFLFDIKKEAASWPWTDFPRRAVETTLARLRTGHAGVAQYLFRFQLTQSPLCSCGEIETISHYLLICPVHDIPRNNLKRNLENEGIKDTLSLKLLLGGSNQDTKKQVEIIRLMSIFIEDTGKLYIL